MVLYFQSKKSGQKIFRESQPYSKMGINGGRERGYTLWEGDPHPLIVPLDNIKINFSVP